MTICMMKWKTFNQMYKKIFASINPAGKYWSPWWPLKILFDHAGDVPICRPWDVSIWRPGDVRLWRSKDGPGRLIWDVPSTFSRRPLEDLQSTQSWMSQHFVDFFFRAYSIDQIYLNSRCIKNPVNL